MSEQLPLKTLKLAGNMFARDSGFSGPQLHEFFAEYVDDTPAYQWGGSPSRWQIFEDLLGRLPLSDQKQVLLDLCAYDGPMSHGPPSSADKVKLRSQLSGISPAADVLGSAARKLSWSAVEQDLNRARQSIASDPADAMTSARATLESAAKHVLDERSIPYKETSSPSRLYKQALSTLGLGRQEEEPIKQLTGGLLSVVEGTAGLRNVYGDSHGKGLDHSPPDALLAELVVNAAFAATAFLIQLHIATASAAENDD